MKEQITEEDKKVWQDFVQNIKKIDSTKRKNHTKSKIFYNKTANYELKSRIDLHGFTINEAYEILYSFLEVSKSYGRKKVHVITGKGKKEESETLNKLVPRWLKEKPMSNFVASADFLPFNSGELVVNLKK